MESDANKRQRGNSITATTTTTSSTTTSTPSAHPNPSESSESPNVGPSPPGNEHTRQSTIERCIEDQTYVSGAHRDKIIGNPHPRSQPIFPGSPERSKRASAKEKAPTLEPPVTKATLSELDVTKIINNPKLRHDINFDPDLHFRPNLDGDKGRRKAQKGNEFWETMQKNLHEFLSNRDQFDRDHTGVEWCLPVTLKAIRAILETLIPPQDCASIEETFNVDLLMQQFRKGVADMPKLARWLSQLLKSHCAPMRDNWVDDMVLQLSDGDRNFDVPLLVVGIKSLLAVLEAMKLDIANHQIRCLRPALIDNTVEFEQRFFTRKIKLGRLDVVGAYAWYRRAESIPDLVPIDPSRHPHGSSWPFFKALVNLTMPSKENQSIPHTFLFDEERLMKLRADLLDLVNLEVCMFHYHSLQASSAQSDLLADLEDSPGPSGAPSPRPRPNSPASPCRLSSATLPAPDDFTSCKRRRNRTVGRFERDYGGMQTFVPRLSEASCSPEVTSSAPNCSRPETPPYNSTEASSISSAKATASLRSALVAILASAPATLSPKQKWSLMSADLALQILRSTPTPLTHLQQFEKHLAFHLSESRSRIFQSLEQSIIINMLPLIHQLVEVYTPKSTFQIFEAATAPRPQPRVAAPASHKEDVLEIATRIAHLGVLHWQVWGEWFYLRGLDSFFGIILTQS